MKITKQDLKRIIKEELTKTLEENVDMEEIYDQVLTYLQNKSPQSSELELDNELKNKISQAYNYYIKRGFDPKVDDISSHIAAYIMYGHL